MNLIYSQNHEKKSEFLSEIKNWYVKNNLYLPPEIREVFWRATVDTDLYEYLRDETHAAGREQKDEEWKGLKEELQKKFSGIVSLPGEIQNYIDDLYYNYD